MDTIFALSSGAGRAGVAVIRVSGPQAGAALQALAGALPEARRAVVRTVHDVGDGQPIDRALVLWMPGPDSFTGEDVAELHVHGGRAVIAATLAALGAVPGLRPAEAGEFTRRAFAAGRMDLVEVEGLGDLIAADTSVQMRAALRTAAGEHQALIAAWRDRIVRAMALVEASIDFSDEADVPADLRGEIVVAIDSVLEQIGRHLCGARAAERLRDGVQVVIAGPPNAGKSTLLNALAGRDVAIVSAEAGTTRDVIEVELDLGGYPLLLADTAGLRERVTGVEAEGIRRARARAEAADLVLWLEAPDASAPPPPDIGRHWRVGTKADRGQAPGVELAISAQTGAGLDELLERLRRFAADTIGGDADIPLFLRERQRQALQRCSAALAAARLRLAGDEVELAAEEMRVAARALAAMVGQVDVEDLLDVIFREFCIGK